MTGFNANSGPDFHSGVDENQIRSDFPVTKKTIYMNNGAVAPTPLSTIKATTDFMIKCSIDGPDSADTSEYINSLLSELRTRVAYLINCDKSEVIFTQSTTEGLNMVANGMNWKKGDRIVVRGGRHEHHANYFPWVAASARSGAVLEELQISDRQTGYFDMAEFEKACKGSRLVTMSHALYNTGAIIPVEEVGRVAHDNNCLFCIDAAQTAGAVEIDVKKIGCQFMAFPGFKWLVGPSGIGVLYCSKEASEFLLPDRTGGENAILSDGNNIAYTEMPARLQAGFRNYPGAAGLESSLRYVLRLNIENIREKNAAVARALRDELASIPSVKFYGPEDPKLRTSIVSFTIPELDSTDVVKRLERDGVVLADREVAIIGPGDQSIKAIRASPHFFNTEEEASSVARWIRSYCS